MNLDTSTQQIIGLAIISLLLGYSLFLFMKSLLPRRIKAEYGRQRDMLINKANQRRNLILKDSEMDSSSKFESNLEELDMDIEDTKNAFETESISLDSQAEFIEAEEKRLNRKLEITDKKEKQLNELTEKYNEHSKELKYQEKELQKKYASLVEIDVEKQLERMSDKLITEREVR